MGGAERSLNTPCSLHLADPLDYFIGSLAVLVPELRKLSRRKIARLETHIGERLDELRARRGLVDRGGQCRDDRGRRALWREQTDPKIVGHVVAQLLHGRDIGERLGAL